MINGNTAWTLENILAPPASSSGQSAGGNESGAQQLASTIGQDVQAVREAIPLLRDPRVRVKLRSPSDPRGKGKSAFCVDADFANSITSSP